MELLLVRHGIAADRDASEWADDAGRPLTEEGIARFRKAAKGLGSLVPKVDALLTSPLIRAVQTANILHEVLGWPGPRERQELEPGTSPKELAGTLTAFAGAEAVALVGHEPDLSELASYLLTGDGDAVAIELKKGGVISLGIDGAPEPGRAVFYWAIPPRALRGI